MLKFELNLSGTEDNELAVTNAIEKLRAVNCWENILREQYGLGLMTVCAPNLLIANFIIDTVYGKEGEDNPRMSNTEIIESGIAEVDKGFYNTLVEVEHLKKVIQSQKEGQQALVDYIGLDKFKGSIENKMVNVDDITLRINEAKHNTFSVESHDYSSLGE